LGANERVQWESSGPRTPSCGLAMWDDQRIGQAATSMQSQSLRPGAFTPESELAQSESVAAAFNTGTALDSARSRKSNSASRT
jgi:hypothetical protein